MRRSVRLVPSVALVLVACTTPAETDLKGGIYASTLEDCNRTAATLCASIACENHARAAAGRLPRDLPASCTDAGTK